MTSPTDIAAPLASGLSSTTGSGDATRFTRAELSVPSPQTKMVLGKGAPDAYTGFTAYTDRHIWISSEGKAAANQANSGGFLAQSGERMWLQTCTSGSSIYGIAKKEFIMSGATGVMLMGQGGVSVVAGLTQAEIDPVDPSTSKDTVEPPKAATGYAASMSSAATFCTIIDTTMAIGLTLLGVILTAIDEGKKGFNPIANVGFAIGSLANLGGAFGNIAGMQGWFGSDAPGANLYGEAGLFVSTPTTITAWGGAGLLQSGLFVETLSLAGATVFGGIDASILSMGIVAIEGRDCTIAGRKDVSFSARMGKAEVVAPEIQIGTATLKTSDPTWFLSPTSKAVLEALSLPGTGGEITVGEDETCRPRQIIIKSPGTVGLTAPEIKIECEDDKVIAKVLRWAAIVNKSGAKGVQLGTGPQNKISLTTTQSEAQVGQSSLTLAKQSGTSSLKSGPAKWEVAPSAGAVKIDGQKVTFS